MSDNFITKATNDYNARAVAVTLLNECQYLTNPEMLQCLFKVV